MTLTRRGRVVRALLIVLVLLMIAVASGAVYLRSIGVNGTSHPSGKVTFTIPKGSTAQEIGRILTEAGVIKSAFGFRIAAFLDGGFEDVQAGDYQLPRGLTARDALRELVESGPLVAHVDVTFPEGSWLTDFARIVGEKTHISGDSFLNVVTSGRLPSRYRPSDVKTMEGLLFPSTYQVVDSDTAVSLATRLAREFEKRVDALDFSEAESRGLTPYQAIIVASMIEAEARVDEDRPKIAAVIYNRLDQGMKLGIDATVEYALGEHRSELTLSDLAVDSPYNTRKYVGLPPTPIGAPGESSLEAALAPADGPWLYYVLADCEGHHAFSVDYDTFLRNKETYQGLDC
ncbi:MAG TPA: endolytic transglycosylase MltG [Actinomycetota bacterium]|nr:endolytic transglycosylase MltG [Actinomycetota bacterium]